VALNANNSAGSPTETVVVAAADLQPRIPITPQQLLIQTIPVPNTYPKVFFSQVQEVVGMVPLVGISKDQAVTANEVARPSQALGSQSEYLPIPSGYVGLTIPTSEEQGVAYNIQPDDYISVIATVSVAGKVADKTIFTNLHVIKVGMPGGTGSPSSLTVVVTQCQAEVLTWFLTYASLKYTLESYHDYQPGAQSPDPACPSIEAAKGVTLQVIQTAYPTLF
jgi:Flp pilus assembly protein CpaB